MPERYERVRVGWHCAKVKGHAELKIQKLKRHLRCPCAPNMVHFRLLFSELWHLKKIGACHFSLIGRHLENVGRTELFFELILAPSNERPTYEFRSDSVFFLSSYRHKLQPLYQGKGQRLQKAKYRTEPFPGKIGREILNLVALGLTVTELFNKVVEKV